MKTWTRVGLILTVGLTAASPLLLANRNFVPDWTFKGSSLTGFKTIGHAEWKATNGEIVGTPTSADGGWLVLDKSLQDLQFAAAVRCTGDCTAGVMVRAQQTADGMKGVFVPFGKADTAAASLTTDKDGRETAREPLGRAGGMVRIVAPPAAAGAGAPAGGRGGAPGGAPAAAPGGAARGGGGAGGAAGRGGAGGF